jgi:hypothetical protein
MSAPGHGAGARQGGGTGVDRLEWNELQGHGVKTRGPQRVVCSHRVENISMKSFLRFAVLGFACVMMIAQAGCQTTGDCCGSDDCQTQAKKCSGDCTGDCKSTCKTECKGTCEKK